MSNKTIWIGMTLLSVVVQFLISSCGNSAKSANTNYAEAIPSNLSGFTCFIIRDENAKAVGGNCVKD